MNGKLKTKDEKVNNKYGYEYAGKYKGFHISKVRYFGPRNNSENRYIYGIDDDYKGVKNIDPWKIYPKFHTLDGIKTEINKRLGE